MQAAYPHSRWSLLTPQLVFLQEVMQNHPTILACKCATYASIAGGLKSVIQQLAHHCQDTNATPTKGICVVVDSLTVRAALMHCFLLQRLHSVCACVTIHESMWSLSEEFCGCLNRHCMVWPPVVKNGRPFSITARPWHL